MERVYDEQSMDYIEKHPVAEAIAIGRKEPYYLTYLRQGKPNPKPKEGSKDGTGIHNQ